MTFNEKRLQEFKWYLGTDSMLKEVKDWIEQALLDKEQEVLRRVHGCINIYDQDNVLLVEEVQDKIVKNIKKEFKQ